MPLDSRVLMPCSASHPLWWQSGCQQLSPCIPRPSRQVEKDNTSFNRPCKCPKIPPCWFWLGPLAIPELSTWLGEWSTLLLQAWVTCISLQLRPISIIPRRLRFIVGWLPRGKRGVEMETSNNNRKWSLPWSVDVKNAWADSLFLKWREGVQPAVLIGTGHRWAPSI